MRTGPAGNKPLMDANLAIGGIKAKEVGHGDMVEGARPISLLVYHMKAAGGSGESGSPCANRAVAKNLTMFKKPCVLLRETDNNAGFRRRGCLRNNERGWR